MADSIKKKILLKINKYKRSENNLERALELCNNPDYRDDVSIQHQKMEILCMLKRYSEAIAIGERLDFTNEMSIQLKLVEAYAGNKNYEKANAICMRPEYAEHPGFIQKAERIKKDLFRINGIEAKVTSNEFEDYIKEIDRLIEAAKEERNPGRARQFLRKAQGYCTDERFKDNIEANLYLIKILKLLGEYELALETAIKMDYLNNMDAFIQIPSILAQLKRYDEALSLIDKSPFNNNPNIINLKQSIMMKKEGKVTPSKPKTPKTSNKKTKALSFNDLLDYIEGEIISLEVIKSLPISQLLKDIFIIAYYEVRENKDAIYKSLGDMASCYENNDECLSIIEDLENHFKKADSTYNRELYQKCLLISQNIKIDNSRKN
ncbi:MAG: hypothetical protein IKR74_04890 [Bacilli bacterium]|nr:hypothetical protein [Bacilli bacterium]